MLAPLRITVAQESTEHIAAKGFGLARAIEKVAVIGSAGRTEVVAYTAQGKHEMIIIEAARGQDFLTVIVVYWCEKHLAGFAIQPDQDATLKAVAIGPSVTLV